MRIHLDNAYTAEEIAAVTGGRTHAGMRTAGHLTTDSREVEPGDLFVALRGEHVNGHAYLDEAIANGASLLLYEEEAYTHPNGICVKSCEDALCALARRARERINPTVIAITGSAGKTTTKNMVAAVLESTFRTHKTQGNQNNMLGVCMTLLSMPQDTEMLVVEMGMNHEGEIKALSLLTSPDVAVITNIGHAHIGNLGSRERIASAKREILAGCTSGAIYLIPSNEPLLDEHIPADVHCRRIGENGDCYFQNLTIGSNTTVADFTCHTIDYPAFSLPGIGTHIALCASFAIEIGQTFGVSPDKIRRALAIAPNDKMRQELIRRNGMTIIADCYNASPESMRAACDTLLAITREQHGRSLALLGDMLELGEESNALHKDLGAYCAKIGIDFLFTFGAAAEQIAYGARHGGMAEDRIFSNPTPSAPQASALQIDSVIRHGDVLLIKASRAMAAERILSLLDIKSKECREKQT